MKRKLPLIFLTLLCLCACVSGITACNVHTHSFSEWSVEKAATCTENGIKFRSCSCGKKETQLIIAAHNICYEFDETGHWQVCRTCYQALSGKTNHAQNETCKTCKYKKGDTAGLKYYYYKNNYIVSGLGTAEDTSIQIPSVYRGLPVIEIADYAFKNCSPITDIIIPDSITKIGVKAFYNCSSLKNINIPDSVTYIGNSAFYGCSSLKSIILPDGISTLYNETFKNCFSLENIIIPENLTKIYQETFTDCCSLKRVNIPNNLTEISYRTFYNCSSLESVTIPDRVKEISYRAFYNCSSLKNIEFKGTVEQWNNIEKENKWNDVTGEYVIHCTDGDIAKDGTVTMKGI